MMQFESQTLLFLFNDYIVDYVCWKNFCLFVFTFDRLVQGVHLTEKSLYNNELF